MLVPWESDVIWKSSNKAPDSVMNHDCTKLHAVFGQSDKVKLLFDSVSMPGSDSSQSSSEDRERVGPRIPIPEIVRVVLRMIVNGYCQERGTD